MRRWPAAIWAIVVVVLFCVLASGIHKTSKSQHDSNNQLNPISFAETLSDGIKRRQFVLSCTPCHQLKAPNRYTSVQDWKDAFARMREIDGPNQYGTRLIADFDDQKMARWLAGELRKIKPQKPSHFDRAVVTEYTFGPRTGFYHDMEYVQGKAWSADFFGNVLYSVDPATKEVKEFPIVNPEKTKGALGAHTINKSREGKLWITFLITGQVARFDPATGQFTFYGGFDSHSHVHSFALSAYGYVAEDEQRRIWVTHFTEEYLSRLDPASGTVERFALPHSRGFQPQQVHPYAVSMDRQGRLWYTKLQSNTLGVLDPKSGNVREFSMPRKWSGPRRLAIDTDGYLWIPEYTTNRLTVFDTKRMKFLDSYSLPSKGDYPYALRVNEMTGEIWLTGTGTDSLYRFNPKTKQFHHYRLPSRVAYSRVVTFDEAGNAWTVYGSFPNTFGPYTSGVIVKVKPTDA